MLRRTILPLRERAGPERRCHAERRDDHRGADTTETTTGEPPWACSTGCAGAAVPVGAGTVAGTLDRGSQRADLAPLEQFVATRRGVEGYVEPRTAVTETTIVLVAANSEWTGGASTAPTSPGSSPGT